MRKMWSPSTGKLIEFVEFIEFGEDTGFRYQCSGARCVVCDRRQGNNGALKIPNPKHQITNKSQNPKFNDRNRFGIFNFDHW